MRKLLIALALIATPVAAQEVKIPIERFNFIQKNGPAACRQALYARGSDYIDSALSILGITDINEKILLITICKGYLIGRQDELNS